MRYFSRTYKALGLYVNVSYLPGVRCSYYDAEPWFFAVRIRSLRVAVFTTRWLLSDG